MLRQKSFLKALMWTMVLAIPTGLIVGLAFAIFFPEENNLLAGAVVGVIMGVVASFLVPKRKKTP